MQARFGRLAALNRRRSGALEVRVDEVGGHFGGRRACEERGGVQEDVVCACVVGVVVGLRGEEGEVGDVDGGFGFARECRGGGREISAHGDLVDKAGGADLREDVDAAVGRAGELRLIHAYCGGSVGTHNVGELVAELAGFVHGLCIEEHVLAKVLWVGFIGVGTDSIAEFDAVALLCIDAQFGLGRVVCFSQPRALFRFDVVLLGADGVGIFGWLTQAKFVLWYYEFGYRQRSNQRYRFGRQILRNTQGYHASESWVQWVE